MWKLKHDKCSLGQYIRYVYAATKLSSELREMRRFKQSDGILSMFLFYTPQRYARHVAAAWVCPLSKSGPQSESSWCRCACKPPAALRGLRARGAWRWGGASGRQYGCKDRCSSRKLHRGSDAVASDLLSSRSFSVRVARLAGLLCGSCTRACSTASCP